MSDLKVIFEKSSGNYLVEVLEDTGRGALVQHVVLLSSDTDDQIALVRLTVHEDALNVAEALLAAAEGGDK